VAAAVACNEKSHLVAISRMIGILCRPTFTHCSYCRTIKMSSTSKDFAKGMLAGAAASVAIGGAAFCVLKHLQKAAKKQEEAGLSTTSSAHSGSVYETDKAVAEYLQFHFGADEDILPFAEGPKSALNFASRYVTGMPRCIYSQAASLA
jgi:hypothetical protein